MTPEEKTKELLEGERLAALLVDHITRLGAGAAEIEVHDRARPYMVLVIPKEALDNVRAEKKRIDFKIGMN